MALYAKAVCSSYNSKPNVFLWGKRIEAQLISAAQRGAMEIY